MNLRQELKLLKGKNIKVGSANGFIYCDICNKDIENIIENISVEYYNNLLYFKNKTIEYYTNFNSIWKTKIDNKIKKLKKRCEIDNQVNYNNELKELKKQLDLAKKDDYTNTKKRIEYLKRRIKEFTPFLSREVLEVYDSTYDDGTKIVIFKGEENGAYWNRGEYINKKNYKRKFI